MASGFPALAGVTSLGVDVYPIGRGFAASALFSTFRCIGLFVMV